MSKIPIKNLDVYNDIYGLGITQTEITEFENLWTLFEGSCLTYIYGPGPKNQDFILKFNEYDKTIQLEETDPNVKLFGYNIFRLKNRRYYLKYMPKPEDLEFLERLGEIINSDKQSFVFNSLDEIRNHVFSTKDIDLFLGYGYLNTDDIKTLYWLCGKLNQYKESKFTNMKRYKDMPEYVSQIIDVIQLSDDTRIALYVVHSNSYRYTTSDNFVIKKYITKPDDASYNWTDPERYFSHENKKTKHPKAFYIGPNPVFPPEDALSKYIRGHSQVVIENQTLEMIIKRDERKKIEDAAIQKAQSAIQTKLNKKIEGLENGEEFSFNDVTFRSNEIEYENQIIKSNYIKVKDIVTNFINNLEDDAFNFELIFEGFCRALIKQAQTKGKVTAEVGTVHINLEIRSKKNTAGITMVTNYVNEYRINKDELLDVLQRALCYNKNEDYENYLESVSKCSLRYHRFIASGIQLKVHDTITGEDIEFKIGLDRDKNRNYISYGDSIHYPVKDSNKLLNLVGSTDMARVINVLLNPDIVGIKGSDIKYIIENGRKALEVERNKEKQMLEQAIELFKCEKLEEALLDNGRVVDGYTIKGKLREYIIETSTIRVFEYPSGKYLCMVDKGQNEHANIARLVSRMFALANDSKLANEITTLQK
jgi:hypothetical protein